MSPKNRRSLLRKARFESFEERLALSAQPLAALAVQDEAPMLEAFGELAPVQHFSTPTIAPEVLGGPLEGGPLNGGEPPVLQTLGAPDFQLADTRLTQVQQDQVNPFLARAHAASGVDFVHNEYGLSGSRQTIAIIDSGVDYLHSALGGGLGSLYRVVGGYDFAENDADPFDDGPAGFHGTHVAGIAASDHASRSGVASGADIVALRVFDDQGAGYFHWVEQALQWVHENRDAFENEITTVNLSLGAEWNSDTAPSWANLEDEFAQLEADGIFVAVAAGNSFSNYNQTGLAYPAVSPYVVPVSSVDANGLMSSFSQRHERVLAAPGSSITSTVPDHVFGADGNHNDFGAASGTSMASPYVAASSMLVREAMEFVGMANVTQDQIYDHFRETADVFFDSATNANYHRINVRAAIDALMPEDDYGSTVNDAHVLGSLTDQTSFDGSITRLTDADYFTFTAAATGELTLNAEATHDLTTTWLVNGATTTASSLTIDVIAGQSYSFSLTTNDGLGHYSVTANMDGGAEDPGEDWGVVESMRISDVAVAASNSYRLEAARDGRLTVEALFAHSQGDINLQLVDANNNIVASSNSTSNNERLDVTVERGDVFTLQVAGANSSIDFRLTNLVEYSVDDVLVTGVAGDDAFQYDSQTAVVTINDVVYDVSGANSIRFDGGGGENTFASSIHTTAELIADGGSVRLSHGNTSVSAIAVQTVDVTADGGEADLFGDASDDTFVASPESARLQGDGYAFTATGFNQVNAFGRGGTNTATLIDSDGNDAFIGRSAYSYLRGDGFLNQAIGFERVEAHASSGFDTARLYDTQASEQFWGRENYSYLAGDGFLNVANRFERVDAYSSGGADSALLFDTSGDDRFVARSTYSYLQSDNITNTAWGFGNVRAISSQGGNDTAKLYDTEGDELFVGRDNYAYLSGQGFTNTAEGFGRVSAYSSGGYDTARLSDSIGDDQFTGRATYAYMLGDGYLNTAYGFERVDAFATSGNDRARLFDTSADEAFFGRPTYAYVRGAMFLNVASNFDRVDAYSSGGFDRAYLTDSSGDDLFVGRERYSYLIGDGYLNVVHGYEEVTARSVFGGNDRADLYGTSGAESLTHNEGVVRMQGDRFDNRADGFARNQAYGGGGADRAVFEELGARDSIYGRDNFATLTTQDRDQVTIFDFEELDAEVGLEGSPDTDLDSVDYVFEELGES